MEITKVIVAVLLLQSGALPQDEPPAAAEVLATMRSGLGDEEVLSSLHSVLFRGTASVPAMPGATFVEAHVGERAQLVVEYPGVGTQSQRTNGEYSWTTDPAIGIMVKRGEEQRPVQRMFAVLRHAPWQELYQSAETIGSEDLQGVRCWRLKMSPENGQPEAWLVDASTNRLFAFELGLPNPMGGSLPMRFLYRDWREVDGIQFPFHRTLQVGAVAIEYRMEQVTVNADVAAEHIEPPAAVVAAAEDPDFEQTPNPSEPGTCKVVTTKPQQTASIRAKVNASEISRNLAVMLPEVMAHISRVGGTLAGPPYSRYHGFEDGVIDLEAGIPVEQAIEEGSRVRATTLAGGKVATTWHQGEYHRLPESHELLEEWIEAQNLETAGPYWEVYWTDPGIEPDPARWRTQVLWPVN